jgi:peroxiredoxin
LRSTPSSSAERPPLRRDPKAWILVAICVLVPAALLVVALQAGGDGDGARSGDGRPTVSTIPGLTPDRVVRTGDRAPGFRLTTLDGETLDTVDFRGTPYIVTFWGSWCVPCRDEMPLLQDAYEEHRGTLQVVGVTYQDAESDSRDFAREYGITFPLAPDDGLTVARAFGVLNGVPQTFFVDGDGIVRDRVAGITEREDLDAPLGRLLG